MILEQFLAMREGLTGLIKDALKERVHCQSYLSEQRGRRARIIRYIRLVIAIVLKVLVLIKILHALTLNLLILSCYVSHGFSDSQRVGSDSIHIATFISVI